MPRYSLLDRTVGRYVIRRFLDRAGLGEVYVGDELGSGRKVAIKVLGEELGQRAGLSALFLDEAHASAALAHPNLVQVLFVGQLDERSPFLVMELLEGTSLWPRIKRGEAMGPDEVKALVDLVAAGLTAIHQAGRVHRDLKPQNIILTREAGPELKLLDIGLARVCEALPPVQRLVGLNPRFAAPEQLREGAEVGPAADLYSLGAVLYALLSGRTLFEDLTAEEIIRRRDSLAIEPLSTRRPELPDGVSRLVERCLQRDPEARPGSAEELAAEYGRGLAFAKVTGVNDLARRLQSMRRPKDSAPATPQADPAPAQSKGLPVEPAPTVRDYVSLGAALQQSMQGRRREPEAEGHPPQGGNPVESPPRPAGPSTVLLESNDLGISAASQISSTSKLSPDKPSSTVNPISPGPLMSPTLPMAAPVRSGGPGPAAPSPAASGPPMITAGSLPTLDELLRRETPVLKDGDWVQTVRLPEDSSALTTSGTETIGRIMTLEALLDEGAETEAEETDLAPATPGAASAVAPSLGGPPVMPTLSGLPLLPPTGPLPVTRPHHPVASPEIIAAGPEDRTLRELPLLDALPDALPLGDDGMSTIPALPTLGELDDENA